MNTENYLTLTRPHRKAEIAFLMSMKMIFESARQCYFWTLTPAWPMGDNRFARAVNAFCKAWRHRVSGSRSYGTWGPGFMAIRVFEPFKSGYLHCHFVCNRRLPAKDVWDVAAGTGIGRVDVRVCNVGVADYLCKYLRKEHQLPGRRRTWAKWGDWEHVRINNVEIDSAETRLMKWCRMQMAYETRYTQSTTTGEIFRTHVKKPKGRAWVDARVMFGREMERMMRNRHPRLLVERDGRFCEK